MKKEGKKKRKKELISPKNRRREEKNHKRETSRGQQEHSVCPACLQKQLKARIYVDDRRQFRVVLYSIL